MGISQTQSITDNRWRRTLYIIFVAQLVTAIGFSSIFPFLPLYVESLGTNTALSVEMLAGLVYSAQAFTMMIASPVWGVLADRYGRKLMVERAMFGGSIIVILMAFVQTAEQLVVLRAIQGLVTGTIAAASALVAAAVPRERMGYSMGLLQVSLGAGVALGPLIGGSIADTYDYNYTFYVTSALLFSAGLMVWLGVEENFEPNQKLSSWGSFVLEWRQILSAPGIITTYSMRFITQLGRMMIVPIAPLFIQTLLINSTRLNTFTGLVVGAASASATISAVYLGRLGDRIGHQRIFIICTLGAGLLYVPQSLVTAGWQLLILQASVGIALGGVIPAISALLAHYTRSGEEGAVYGLDNSINAGSRALAPLLGAAIGYLFGLRVTFVVTAIFFLVASMLAAWSLPKLDSSKPGSV